ncbi:peptidase C39 [Trinickia terrae]|uniref:Peptidase C39 n=1 Tax=Trinickia terrae TaxID=2571161 RepID=A0A4U1HR22_9BURK|nr:peptidase C39 [Trinickia terrae]TKC83929.1 peptidase C39 [Trinickia terrae]
MKHPFSPLGLALCLSACSVASGVSASENTAMASPGFLSTGAASQAVKWQAVDDDVLASQTGKYAGSSMISGFVLNLLSQWHLPDGATAVAQGSLAVTANADDQMSAQVRTSAHVHDRTNAGSNGANPHAIATGGQNISVNGVSQVTQVAGNGNVGSNSTTIDFSNASIPSIPGGANSPSANASNASGSIKASIAFDSGGVTVALKTPAGLAAQSVAPNNTQQAGAVAQLLQIAGNNQAVSNALQLHLQTQQMSGNLLRQLGVMQALQNRSMPGR